MRFTTLYPNCSNVELVKDVGQIPYMLSKLYDDIEATLVGCNIDLNGSNIDSISGVKIKNIKAPFNNLNLSGILYLMFNSRNIDILNVYHAGRRTYFYTKFYKFLNPKGKVYLKLDLDFRSCEMYDNDQWERKLFNKVTKSVDFVSVESEAVRERIQIYSNNKIEIIGNGFCETSFNLDIYHKNNSFITVGRLGTKQKATEIILEAFAKTSRKHDWNLILIGSIEEEFIKYIENFYTKYPELKNRVLFKGAIHDRKTLYKEYASAKVFLLPSRWEGFCLVAGEALSCGCRMILSDKVPPNMEVTNNLRFGEVVKVEDVTSLASAMISETKRTFNENEIKNIKDYAEEKFSWFNICVKLNTMLRN